MAAYGLKCSLIVNFHLPGTKNSAWKSTVDTNSVQIDSSFTFSRGRLPVFQVQDQISISQQGIALQDSKNTMGALFLRLVKSVR